MARPSREGPPQQRWGWERERTDQNSEPEACSWTRAEAVGGVERVSEQRKSQNHQNQQILLGLETSEGGSGDLIKEQLTHAWTSHHLS